MSWCDSGPVRSSLAFGVAIAHLPLHLVFCWALHISGTPDPEELDAAIAGVCNDAARQHRQANTWRNDRKRIVSKWLGKWGQSGPNQLQ